MIAKDLVTMLRWRKDGKELYYRGRDGRIMAVDVTTSGSGFQHGPPTSLFHVPVNLLPQQSLADVTADGQRFLFAMRTDSRDELIAELNWTADLKR